MKLPKLNLITAGDDLRPAMNHVCVNKEHIVATDAHVIAMFDRSIIDECISDLPDEFYVEAYQWKVLTTEFLSARYYSDTGIIMLVTKKGIERYLRIRKADQVEFTYPSYKQVIPTDKPRVPVDAIGLNKTVLNRFLSVVPHYVMALEFRGCMGGILVTCPNDPWGFTGMIMPCVVNE